MNLSHLRNTGDLSTHEVVTLESVVGDGKHYPIAIYRVQQSKLLYEVRYIVAL